LPTFRTRAKNQKVINNLKNSEMNIQQAMSTPQKEHKTGQWDTFHSTYYWNIHLDLDHPQNSTPVLTGYSKKVGEAEAQDKDQLLKRKIINLFLHSYFKRMKRIDIFLRTEFVIDKKRDPKILVLYPTHYDIPELNHDVIFKKFGPFLKDFYERALRGGNMDGLLPKTRALMNGDDFLNPENYKFKSVAHLYSHAARCLIHGHAEGAVNAFIYKVKALNHWT
jgi:hypothetical protein